MSCIPNNVTFFFVRSHTHAFIRVSTRAVVLNLFGPRSPFLLAHEAPFGPRNPFLTRGALWCCPLLLTFYRIYLPHILIFQISILNAEVLKYFVRVLVILKCPLSMVFINVITCNCWKEAI